MRINLRNLREPIPGLGKKRSDIMSKIKTRKMNGWNVLILNKWKLFIPKLSVSFDNGWVYKPWVDQGYGTFRHLCHLVVDRGDWLKKFDKQAPDLEYAYSIHVWLLEVGMHVYIG